MKIARSRAREAAPAGPGSYFGSSDALLEASRQSLRSSAECRPPTTATAYAGLVVDSCLLLLQYALVSCRRIS